MAWALGGNGRWRLVTVIGDSFFEKIDVRNVLNNLNFWWLDS